MNIISKNFFIFLLCTLLFPTYLFSQNQYKRKISISEWIEEMEQCKKQVYYLQNTEIYYEERKDTLYSFMQPRTQIPSEKDKKREKSVSPIIVLKNCKLPDNKTCQVRNVIFNNNVTFAKCGGASQLIFYNCTFKQGLELLNSDLNAIEFWYCSMLQKTFILETQNNLFLFKNCSFSTDYKVPKSFYHYGDEKENYNCQYLFRIIQNQKKITTLRLSHCKLLPSEVKPIIAFDGGKYDVIAFEETDFGNSIINFSNCSVKENFIVQKCKFKQPFGAQAFNFPKDNTSFNWNQIDSVGIGLYEDYAQVPYTSKTDTLISDVDSYNELNSSYRKFYSMYRTRGDIESANACYKQMKDMETRKYHHLYQQNSGVHTWFNWRFNQFLKYFSEYGTNPVQSLIISMWTTLLFAAVYFFFYSNWDGINRSFLIKQHRKIMYYFRSGQRLEDFYVEGYLDDLKSFADYKKEILDGKAELPLFIVLLGRPLYLFSVIKHKIITFLYRRAEILQGRWIDLKPARKAYVASLVFFYTLIYIISLIFLRALNSTTLSINAFSTLGFGAIPVKGLSRYITIIEGFLGWFLLSIFSVSLISQMLQN